MARLRIGIDARMDKPWLSGLGRYARSLARHLTELADPEVQWVIIKHPAMASTRLAAPGSDAEEVVLGGDLDSVGNNLCGALALNRLGLDLYHALENFVPPGLRCRRVVVTTHDLVWVEQPELAGTGRFDWLRTPIIRVFGTLTMEHAYRRADAIISVSEATRAAALRRFPFLVAERITTVLSGVDAAAFPFRSGDEPAQSFFLVLGNSRPNKNVPAVLEALEHLQPPRPRLVVAGRGDGFPALSRRVAELGLEGEVELVRRPSDARVLSLLHGARALLLPSLVEGFGLPVIEAMSAGCPVLASSVPAVEEACAGAALLFDPRSPADIARAMRAVLASRELRDDLRRRGLVRAGSFDWRRCAAQTHAVYRSLLAG